MFDQRIYVFRCKELWQKDTRVLFGLLENCAVRCMNSWVCKANIAIIVWRLDCQVVMVSCFMRKAGVWWNWWYPLFLSDTAHPGSGRAAARSGYGLISGSFPCAVVPEPVFLSIDQGNPLTYLMISPLIFYENVGLIGLGWFRPV